MPSCKRLSQKSQCVHSTCTQKEINSVTVLDDLERIHNDFERIQRRHPRGNLLEESPLGVPDGIQDDISVSNRQMEFLDGISNVRKQIYRNDVVFGGIQFKIKLLEELPDGIPGIILG